jgi:hypothetical protein
MTLFDSRDMQNKGELDKAEAERLLRVEEYALDLLDYMEVSGYTKRGSSQLMMYLRRLSKAIKDGHGK